MVLQAQLILLHGDVGDSALERHVGGVRAAAAIRHVRLAHEAGFDRVVIATDEPGAFAALASESWIALEQDAASPDGFRLQARLAELLDRFPSEAVAVMGAGGLPLLGADDFKAVFTGLAAGDGAVTNNFFSADITAWRPAAALARLQPFERDNQLPRRLRDDAGLTSTVLPRTTSTQFDLDTPVDVAILELHGGAALSCDLGPLLEQQLRAVLPVLVDPGAELIVAGRVGSQAWQYLERETACRVRMYSEERGLAAAGPAHRPRSVLGRLLQLEGPVRFFEEMAAYGNALVLDTRVLEAHMNVAPSRADRFRSDTFEWQQIADSFLREFTKAAAECPIPVLLGGHSLVSGGLMLLNDIAWQMHDDALARSDR